MTAEKYKTACSDVPAERRPIIEATLLVLEHSAPELAARLAEVLAGEPTPKPEHFRGTRDDDFFVLPFAERDFDAPG